MTYNRDNDWAKGSFSEHSKADPKLNKKVVEGMIKDAEVIDYNKIMREIMLGEEDEEDYGDVSKVDDIWGPTLDIKVEDR